MAGVHISNVKRFVVRSSVVIIALCLFLAGQHTADAEGISGEKTIYTVGSPWVQLRTVDIVMYDQNNLVVAWRNEPSAVYRDRGDIMYSYSNDGGETWSPAAYLKQQNSSWTYGNFMFYNEAGTLYVLIGREPYPSGDQTLIAMKSTDKGVTWTDVPLTNSYTGSVIMGGEIIKHGSDYLLPFHNRVGTVTTHGVLKSSNLTDWQLAGIVPTSDNVYLQEGFLVESQDDPNMLIMKMRVKKEEGGYAYSSYSTDGGTTWSNAVPDLDLPNHGVKGALYKDSNGQYVYIYNTEPNRNMLYYKTKKPGEPWNAGKPFTTANEDGKDVYAMLEEYAPGKFYAVWENSYSKVKFAKLDVSDTIGSMDIMHTDWNTLAGWSVNAGSGTVQISPSGQLHLKNSSGISTLTNKIGPTSAFTLEFRAKIEDYTVNNPKDGISLGTKIMAGKRRLMLAIQGDGVYSMTSSSSGWTKVYNTTNDTNWHAWKVTVDAHGKARLYKDGSASLAEWTIPDYDNAAPLITHWVDAANGNSVESRIDWTRITEGIGFSDFNDLDGLTVDSSGGTVEISPTGQLHLLSGNGSNAGITMKQGPSSSGAFTLEFRARVTDYTVNAPANGVSLGVKVNTGTKRLMLAIQSDGIYSMTNSSSGWTKVYNTTNDTNWHVWRVDVTSSGAARLYRDGGTMLASWTIQSDGGYPRIATWVMGTSSNQAEAQVDWLKVY